MYNKRLPLSTEICRILLDNMPLEDIVKLFSSYNFFTNDDLEVISFLPSEYLKRQYLVQNWQHLKISDSVWLMISDILQDAKPTSSVGKRLSDGKLL